MTVRRGRWAATLVTVCLGAACILGKPAAGVEAGAPGPQPSGLRPLAATPVALSGTGSWNVDPEMGDWAAALAGASSPTRLTYTPRGTSDGRSSFVRGEVDFVVTGTPFSTEQDKQLADAHRSYVRLPIMPTALVFLLRSPADGFREVTGDPAAGTSAPYGGPIRMPHVTVARTLLAVANTWDDQELKDAIGHNLGPYPDPIAPVVRSDADAASYYLERYLAAAAPALWDQKLSEAHQPAGSLSEAWPITSLPSKAGAAAVMQAIATGSQPGSTAPTRGGNIGPVPPWAVKAAQKQFASTDLRAVELRNGAGEWVAPTPASIRTAVGAGDGAPLRALSSPDTGAYPLAWVDDLVAPKTGLTLEKTNALAALIRYAATAGQSAASPRGDAALPDPLVRKALAGANEIVAGNCAGPDVKVVSSADPGPYAPAGSVTGAGTMLHCERSAAPPSPSPAPGTPPTAGGSPPAAGSGPSGPGGGLGSIPPLTRSPGPAPSGAAPGSPGLPGSPASAGSPQSSGSTSGGGGGLFGSISSALASLRFIPLPGVAPQPSDGPAPVQAKPSATPELVPPGEQVAAVPKLPFPLPSSSRSHHGVAILAAALLAGVAYSETHLGLLRRRRARQTDHRSTDGSSRIGLAGRLQTGFGSSVRSLVRRGWARARSWLQ